jgi:hypothetical protein
VQSKKKRRRRRRRKRRGGGGEGGGSTVKETVKYGNNDSDKGKDAADNRITCILHKLTGS